MKNTIIFTIKENKNSTYAITYKIGLETYYKGKTKDLFNTMKEITKNTGKYTDNRILFEIETKY